MRKEGMKLAGSLTCTCSAAVTRRLDIGIDPVFSFASFGGARCMYIQRSFQHRWLHDESWGQLLGLLNYLSAVKVVANAAGPLDLLPARVMFFPEAGFPSSMQL